VYNFGGQLIAEYGGAATNGGTSYLTTDHLGSTRVVTNSTAGAVARHDYLPFGEEIPAGTGSNRMAGLGYVTTDDTTQRFTSKERDTESGLDYFGARYYTAAAGRFSGCDPYNAIVDTRKREEFNRYLGEPRNWNRYCFVWNNPLKYVDPSGEDVYVVTYTYGNSEGDEQFKRAADTRANDIRNSEGFDPNKDTVVLQGVYKKEDFAGVLQDANGLEKQYGKVAEVTIFSHTGEQHGPVFHDENGKPTQFTTQEVRDLKVNWSDHANAYFCGCRSANFAQTFADIQGVTSYGFSGGASFSSNPLVKDYRYVFSNNAPVYLRQAARDPFGIGASLTVPMVRRDPPPKDTPRK
jgi:RHS repeat-associated protein